jgi:succinoglycan biosynthesis protein ExoO
MDQPEITVMMPAYNRAELIGRAIDSVRSQSLSDWELIVVDDGSSDATLKVARSYASSDRRIKVFANVHNMGISATRNQALMHARGRFVAPLDSDDWYHPARLERLLLAADEYGVDLLADDLLVIRDGDETPSATLGELCGEPILELLDVDLAGLLQRLGFERDGIAIGLTKPLINRQMLVDNGIEYDTSLRAVEDYWLLVDCAAAGARFMVIPEAYYYYRLHAQNTTNSVPADQHVASSKRRLEAFLASDIALSDPVAAGYARHHIRRMELLTAYGEFTRAIKAKRVHNAAWQVMRQPKLVGEFATRLPAALERRRRARRGDAFAFDPLSVDHRSGRLPVPQSNPIQPSP